MENPSATNFLQNHFDRSAEPRRFLLQRARAACRALSIRSAFDCAATLLLPPNLPIARAVSSMRSASEVFSISEPTAISHASATKNRR